MKSRTTRRLLAHVIACGLLFPSVRVPAARADDAVATFAAPDITPSTLAVSAASTDSAAQKTPEIPVSSRGSFSTSIPIAVPPGHGGMQPNLSISYESASTKDSSIGVGWTFETPRIERSTVHGFPKLVRGSALSYADDTASGARFSIGDTELVELTSPPSTLTTTFTDSTLFVPQRAMDATIFERSRLNDAWVVHHPDGTKAAFGLDPKDSTHTMRIRNELGTYAWQLVREWDENGNHVIYNYVDDSSRSSINAPQQEPVLASVTWGGNDTTGTDIFSVQVKTSPGLIAGPDLLHGNVVPQLFVDEIDVCAPLVSVPRVGGTTTIGVTSSTACAGTGFVRSYKTTRTSSADTGRKLLKTMTVKDGDVGTAVVTTYSYSTNNGKISYSAAAPFTEKSMNNVFTRGTVLDATGAPKATSPEEARTPALISSAFRNVDVDGDGRSDLVYFPSGFTAPFAQILTDATPLTVSGPPPLYQDLVGTVPRTVFKRSDNSWERSTTLDVPYTNQNATHSMPELARGSTVLGLRTDKEYADLADVDGDGRLDGVFFMQRGGHAQDNEITDILRLPPSPRDGACYSESFWGECGAIDPSNPEYEVCTNSAALCEQLTEVNLDTCADGLCWITIDEFMAIFSDLIDAPPLSAEGAEEVEANGMIIDWGVSMIGVPAAVLRARLNIDVTTVQPKKLAAGQADSATCGNMLGLCLGGAADGIPRIHIDWNTDRLDCDISSSANMALTGIDCQFHPTVSVQPPAMYMGIHFGGGSPEALMPTLELFGWPGQSNKTASVVANYDTFLYSSLNSGDFSAPLVDINADGRADVVLLRSMNVTAANAVRPEFEFTPRAYISNESENISVPYYGSFNYSLDWDSFYATYPDFEPRRETQSDFSQSLNDILVHPGVVYASPPDAYPAGNFALKFAYNAFVLDVNADGLPDLVAARPDVISTDGSHALNLDGGHQVFLNRGYRFGERAVRSGLPLSAPSFEAGPLVMLQKGELQDDFPGFLRGVPRGSHLPMAATSLVDINGDGRVDVVFWSKATDTQAISRTVWRNEGDRFTNMGDPFSIPDEETSNTKIGFLALVSGSQDTGLSASRVRGLESADMLRIVDVDDDGLADIVAPGVVCPEGVPQSQCVPPPFAPPGFGFVPAPMRGSVFPAIVWRNLSSHPDMLVKISNTTVGGSTDIIYKNARTTSRVSSAYVPPGMQVVTTITSARDLNSDESRVELSYSDWTRSQSTPESLGFATVSAEFYESFQGGDVSAKPALLTRSYEVSDDVAGIPFAKRGLVRNEVYEADGVRRTVATKWDAATPWGQGSAVRLDADNTSTSECQLDLVGNCLWGVGSTTNVDSRSARGYPTSVTEGDGSDVTVTVTSRLDRDGPWVLGLKSSETIKGRAFSVAGTQTTSATLASVTASYDGLGRLLSRTRASVTHDRCTNIVGALRDDVMTVSLYDAFGNPGQIVTNGLTEDVSYDTWGLYPSKRILTVSQYLDGAVTGTVKLQTGIYNDIRTGAVWTSIDANGATTEVRRDARGRPLKELDANGAVIADHAYVDVRSPTAFLQHDEKRYTSATTAALTRSTFDSAGDPLSVVVYSVSGTTLSDPTRVSFDELDSAGHAHKSYLPELTDQPPTSSSPFVERMFDASGRPTTVTTPDSGTGRTTSYTYLPRETIVTDPLDIERTTITDWRGAATKLTVDAGGSTATTVFTRDGLGRLAQLQDADGAQQNFEYDRGGRLALYNLPYVKASSGTFEQCFDGRGTLVRATDADGLRTQSVADEAGRVVTKIVDDAVGGKSSYYTSYDNKTVGRNGLGRPWRAVTPSMAVEETYELRGFPIKDETTIAAWIGGLSKLTSTRTFGLQGELLTNAQVGSTGVGSFSFSRDNRGRLTKIFDTTLSSVAIASVNAYDAFDRVQSASLGQTAGGVSVTRTWNPKSQDLEDVFYGRSGRTLAEVKSTGFRKDGTPGEEDRVGTIDATGTTVDFDKSWGFDEFGRLKAETVKKNGVTIANEGYTYSLGGRLLTGGGSTYVYGRDDLAGATTALGTRTLTYRKSGSVATDKVGGVLRTLKFDANGCMYSLSSTSGNLTQACDADGNVQYRSDPAVLTLGGSELRPKDGLFVTRLPVGASVELEVAYTLTGARSTSGSRIVMTDMRGSVVATAPAYATSLASTSESQDFDAWGAPLSAGTMKPRHGFDGFEADAATGSYTFGRRMYDPKLRRWLSPDPLLANNPDADASGAQLDRWGYAANNPVRMTDVTGLYGDNEVFWDGWAETSRTLSPEEREGLGRTAISQIPGVGDFIAAGISITEAIVSPSTSNIENATLDVLGAALPVVPALGTLRHLSAPEILVKAHVDDIVKDIAHLDVPAEGERRFIGEASSIKGGNGTVVDTHSTPSGSYRQPDGGRTDVLQVGDHGAGHSHTHDPISNTDPKTGKVYTNGVKQPGRAVSKADVDNIKSGAAKKRTEPLGR